MKKAIVTGANGFVGSWLVKELVARDVEVFAIVKNKSSDITSLLDLDKVRIVYCDLREIVNLNNLISDRDIDVFYHLGWAGSTGAARADYALQLSNTRYACDSAKVAKELACKKFLAAGTVTEKIAERALNLNINAENMIYGVCKHSTHCLLDIVCKKIGIDYVWMQFSNIYGPYNISGNIVSYTLNELIHDRRPSYSKAEQPYDLMYVEDLVHALYLLGKHKTTKNCYFIGSGEPRLLKEYLLDIKVVYGNNCEIGIGERPEDGLKYELNWFQDSQLTQDVGFEPSFTFNQGIRKTIEWIQSGVDK